VRLPHCFWNQLQPFAPYFLHIWAFLHRIQVRTSGFSLSSDCESVSKIILIELVFSKYHRLRVLNGIALSPDNSRKTPLILWGLPRGLWKRSINYGKTHRPINGGAIMIDKSSIKKCDCGQHPELRQSGWGNGHHSHYCPVCKKKWYSVNGKITGQRPATWPKVPNQQWKRYW
jgi:hypothetical protein